MLHNKDIFKNLQGGNIFIDTNVLIGAMYLNDLREFLSQLKVNECEIMTVTGVAIEFYRGSKKLSKEIEVGDASAKGYESRSEFLKKIVKAIYPIEKHLEEM